VIDTDAFQRFAVHKAREAAIARIERLATAFEGGNDAGVQGIGNAWSRFHYGGDFGLVRPSRSQTAVSLVFVQTKDGNTVGPNPSAFGGGATDTHLIYESLSRVAADAVLAGAGSVHRNAFFSVWHPELTALRASLGLRRHPAQIVVSKRGSFDVDALLFSVPEVPVFLIAGDECIARRESALRARPWVRLIPTNGDDLRPAFERLRSEEGIQRVSAIGGRFTATQLVDADLVHISRAGLKDVGRVVEHYGLIVIEWNSARAGHSHTVVQLSRGGVPCATQIDDYQWQALALPFLIRRRKAWSR
jgi:riboflavin biosynthesis pyrimidine reductase